VDRPAKPIHGPAKPIHGGGLPLPHRCRGKPDPPLLGWIRRAFAPHAPDLLLLAPDPPSVGRRSLAVSATAGAAHALSAIPRPGP